MSDVTAHCPYEGFAGDALVKVGRASEAEELVLTTLPEAAREGSLGYQAELTLRLAFIRLQRKQTDQALDAMSRAAAFARAAGGNRILAGIAFERTRVLRAANQLPAAENALRDGIDASRYMGERILLPRLLSQLAEVQLSISDGSTTSFGGTPGSQIAPLRRLKTSN